MPLPWLRILDMVLGLGNVASLARGGAPHSSAAERESSAVLGRTLDAKRLELEREQMERERELAERALKLELLRQAGDREIGRLRLMAGVAVASLVGTLFFSARLAGGATGVRVTLGAGWLLLLAALALSFSAQSGVSRALVRIDDPTRIGDLAARGPGALVPWLIVFGLAAIGIAVLFV